VTVVDREKTIIQIDLAGRALSDVIKEVEACYLSHVMTEADGNKTHAAERAGLGLDTFRRKLQRYTVRTVYRFE
jgi:DNA-binding protein Fis